jgi:hypothetical protein
MLCIKVVLNTFFFHFEVFTGIKFTELHIFFLKLFYLIRFCLLRCKFRSHTMNVTKFVCSYVGSEAFYTFFLKPSSTGLDRPRGLQETETPRIFRQSVNEGGTGRFYTQRKSLVLVSLKAESTAEPQSSRKDQVNEKSQMFHLESNPWPSSL